jgi:hypothetical protein
MEYFVVAIHGINVKNVPMKVEEKCNLTIIIE